MLLVGGTPPSTGTEERKVGDSEGPKDVEEEEVKRRRRGAGVGIGGERWVSV